MTTKVAVERGTAGHVSCRSAQDAARVEGDSALQVSKEVLVVVVQSGVGVD